jgi:hypothetical protein
MIGMEADGRFRFTPRPVSAIAAARIGRLLGADETFQIGGLEKGPDLDLAGPRHGLGQRLPQAIASSMSFTSQMKKPAT